MIKGIVFDLDGVYFSEGKKEFIARVSKTFNLDEHKIKEFFLNSESMREYKKGVKSGREYWLEAIQRWNINATENQLIEMLQKSYKINMKIKNVIESLRKKGIACIVCSNNFEERINSLNERFAFLRDFDYVLLSYEYHSLKPQLFLKINEKTGFKPNEVVIIDDDPSLIKKAKEMGFNSVLYDSSENIDVELQKLGKDQSM